MKLKELEKIKDDISELFKDYKKLATIVEKTLDHFWNIGSEEITGNDVANYIMNLEEKLKIDVNNIEINEVE